MAQTVEQALQAATLYSDGQDYVLVKLPPAAFTAAAGVAAEVGEPFAAALLDKDEVTLVLPAETWADFSRRLPGHTIAPTRYRLLTLDVVLEPTLVGFMARVSAALAQAQVTILPLAAFSRDHLLIPAAQFEAAMSALRALKQN